ncbi:MAG: hypothetical protein WKF74_14065 [Pyrinomonadaceae bacterium]
MSYFTLRFVIALLTFIIGVGVATIWLFHYPDQSHESSHIFNNPDSKTEIQTSTERTNQCQWKQRIGQSLAQFDGQYSEIEKRPSIEKLVMLDGKIRRFFNSRPEFYPCGDELEFRDGKYKRLGIQMGYDELLVYTGKLLVDAHQMDPDSKFRSYTLFSTMDIESASGLGEMPNIRAAYKYEKEFPDGPFIEETLSIIAEFNKDLYMVLRDDLDDYKYDCFRPYINGSPRLTQMSQPQRKAMSYYAKVLTINPTNARARESLEEVNNDTIKSWSFCAD